MLFLLPQKSQAIIQNLLLAFSQHSQIEFTLDWQQFGDAFKKFIDCIKVDSCAGTLKRLIAILILQRGDVIEIEGFYVIHSQLSYADVQNTWDLKRLLNCIIS